MNASYKYIYILTISSLLYIYIDPLVYVCSFIYKCIYAYTCHIYTYIFVTFSIFIYVEVDLLLYVFHTYNIFK